MMDSKPHRIIPRQEDRRDSSIHQGKNFEQEATETFTVISPLCTAVPTKT
jgi:hypothetical protein